MMTNILLNYKTVSFDQNPFEKINKIANTRLKQIPKITLKVFKMIL